MSFDKPQRKVNRNKIKKGMNILHFPENIGPIGMVFTFAEYSYSTTTRSGFEVSIPNENIKGSIMLPIPTTIEDKYGINVGEKELGASGAFVGDLATEGGFEALVDTAATGLEELGASIASAIAGGETPSGSKLSQVIAKGQRTMKYFGRSGIDSLLPNIGTAIDIATGTAINPHKALSFDGVSLKDFTFTWNLSPETESESNAIKRIRDMIRYHSLPEFEGITMKGTKEGEADVSLDRAFLSYPDLVFIELVGLDENHYIKFKPAMISNISLNYSTNGGNAILRGGKPASVQLSLSVKEVRPHNRKDYDPTIDDLGHT